MKLENKILSPLESGTQTADIPILTFHQVGAADRAPFSTIYTDAHSFESRLRWMLQWGYRFIPLSKAVEMISGKRSYEKKCAVITFDDGYEGVYSQAFKILQRYQCPAAVFLIAGTLEGFRETSYPCLNVSQIREMNASGVEFGVHTYNHLDLTKISDEQLKTEVIISKEKIERTCGINAEHFCYPYGKHTQHAEDLVRKAGYKSACTTMPGRTHGIGDLYKLKRISVPQRQNWLQFLYRVELVSRR